jgi:ABC-2 type transport system ATP-binding protein
MAGIQQVSMYGDSLHITTTNPALIDQLVGELRQQGIEIKGQRAIVPSLEDIFIAMVADKQHEAR